MQSNIKFLYRFTYQYITILKVIMKYVSNEYEHLEPNFQL